MRVSEFYLGHTRLPRGFLKELGMETPMENKVYVKDGYLDVSLAWNETIFISSFPQIY